jgi:hypothetical protein
MPDHSSSGQPTNLAQDCAGAHAGPYTVGGVQWCGDASGPLLSQILARIDWYSPRRRPRVTFSDMSSAATGILRGNTITLDSPVPPLEGQRVRVVIALADEDEQIAPAEQAKAWSQWIANGPHGPIEDDGEPEFP